VSALQVAKEENISMTELVRRGLEYMIAVSPVRQDPQKNKWKLPKPEPLCSIDPFENENWRYDLNQRSEYVAEKESP
jgi:hypothetical protein